MNERPYSLEAEESVLGSVLIDSEAFYKVSFLKPSDFYREKNGWVFEAFQALANNGMERDQATVTHHLASKGQLEPIGGAAYLSGLIERTPTSVHIIHYAEIVKRLSSYNQLISVSKEIEEMGYRADIDFDKALGDCLRKVSGLKQNARTKVKTGYDRAERAISLYTAYAEGSVKRTMFGIPSLDKIGGMGPGEYIVLCGETKMGKTTLTKQIADYVAMSGRVLYFTGEMTVDQWNQRDLARLLKQPMRDLADRGYIQKNLERIIRMSGEMAESNILTLSAGVTAEDIYAEAVQVEDLKLIVVDYLQLMKGVTADYKATSHASSQLSVMAKELNIPVIALSQLARDNSKKPEDKKHWTQRLKDSGNIENDADWLLNISRDQDAKPGTTAYREATLAIGYHRQGGERVTIPLQFDYESQIYLERAR